MSADANTPDLAEVRHQDWQRAHQRLQIIRRLAATPKRTRSCMKIAADELQLGIAQTYRLLERYMADPKLTHLLPVRGGRKHGNYQLPAEVDDIIQATIEELYLTRQKPRICVLVTEVRRRCKALGFPTPSRTAVQLRVDARPAKQLVSRRQGRKAARDLFAPAIGSLNAPWPLSLVQIDHTLVDVMVVDSVTRAPIQRPWLTLAIDVCSRCVPGFYLSLEAPSATSVALCIAHAALPKDSWLAAHHIEGVWPVSGIPERLHLDNGRDFHSEALRRGCEQYGICVDYRPVRTPHYGGHIERLIGTMMGKVHLLPGTTFSDVRAKGDYDPQKTAAMTLEEVEQWLAIAIVGVYHRTLHRGIGMTPLTAWQRGIEGDANTLGRGEPTRVTDPRRLLIDFLPIQRRLVRREGVFLHSIAYWADVLSTWIGERGRMIVRYDPRDLSRIYLLGSDGRYYDLNYRDLRRPPISLFEHRLALKRLREEARADIDEDAIFEAIEAMRTIAQRATADTKTLRRQRERGRHLSQRTSIQPTADASIPVQTPAVAPQVAFEPLAPHERIFAHVEEWS